VHTETRTYVKGLNSVIFVYMHVYITFTFVV
jgi:hypothetical protein